MPANAGVGLKPEHYHELLETRPEIGFFEVHTENYMGAGGPPHRYLEALAEHYPLSFHGVGASLGGTSPLDPAHLARWRTLVDRYSPVIVSEHVAWTGHAGVPLHDLLPLPYTQEALTVLCEHIDAMQTALARQILIENPSRYIDFNASEMPETEFLIAAARRTGCGLLLDINNVYVSTCNQDEDARHYLDQIPGELVAEIHLAGHSVQTTASGHELRIDDHGSRVCADVWSLYRETISRVGPRPTLIEWDTNIPVLDELLAEAARADAAASAALTTHQELIDAAAG
jgi:uncharacterized protein (UPF0276 family)